MSEKSKLRLVLDEYKKQFVEIIWPKEKYKWEAVKHFHDNWNLESDDFATMLSNALAKVDKLVKSGSYFPIGMITELAEKAPEEVRAMFEALFDESENIYKRIESFKEQSEYVRKTYHSKAVQHYQNESVIITYLWLRFPDKYYIYKFREVKAFATELDSKYIFKQGSYEDNIRNFLAFYDDVCAELQKDEELKKLLASQLTDDCYPDPALRTLTSDVGHFVSKYYAESEQPSVKGDTQLDHDSTQTNYWFLVGNRGTWIETPLGQSMSDCSIGDIQTYTFLTKNNRPRGKTKNFKEAKVGDMVIGYESSPTLKIVGIFRICDKQEGKEISFEKLATLSTPIAYSTLKTSPELKDMEFLKNSQGSLFELREDEYEFIMNLIRNDNPNLLLVGSNKYTKTDFLREVYMTAEQYDRLAAVLKKKKNIILQGAPGTGKTFAAKRLAYSIMGEKDDKCIEFVQFHQNYSYEDFMMGYKPVENGFELKNGIFYRFCQKAASQPDKDYFFIIDEINRGNLSKIFGELLMAIEVDYRDKPVTLAYNGEAFAVPKNLYIIGMMNTADRSLAMIDYALRRRFSFFDMEPSFDSQGFVDYQNAFQNDTFNSLIKCIKNLNRDIAQDNSLGKGFCIGHSYFCNAETCTVEWLKDIVDFDILPMLSEYWFDENSKVQDWETTLRGVFNDKK